MNLSKIALLCVLLLGGARLNAAISDCELQTHIEKVKSNPDFALKRCVVISAEKVLKKIARNVEMGFLTQEQVDLLTREGLFAVIDSDCGDLVALCPF